EAIERMIRAIDEYEITGIETTLPFGKFVMQHQAFISGNFDTHFVGKYFEPQMLDNQDEEEVMIAAIFATQLLSKKENKTVINKVAQTASAWQKNRKTY
ncbi:MAG: biotin carboxylase, partial [Oligoflexus sp.]|nr:biotin carboxylase [Pseudopedobacter sp.]